MGLLTYSPIEGQFLAINTIITRKLIKDIRLTISYVINFPSNNRHTRDARIKYVDGLIKRDNKQVATNIKKNVRRILACD